MQRLTKTRDLRAFWVVEFKLFWFHFAWIKKFQSSFIFLFSLLPLTAAHSIQLTDDRGREISLTQPAQRIISLAPHLTELVFAAGAGDQLVGVTRFCDYPVEAKKKAVIGDSNQIDFERIVTLKPNLILGWKSGNRIGTIEKLEKLGFKVWVSEPAHLTDIPRLLRAIGVLAGTAAQAQGAAQKFEHDIAALRHSNVTGKKISVFYQVWNPPLITVNRRHLIHDVITLCGGENIFSDLPSLTPSVSIETLLIKDPDVIITSAETNNTFNNALDLWQRYSEIKAVRQKHIYNIHPDLLHRQGPRIIEGAKLMCKYFENVTKVTINSN